MTRQRKYQIKKKAEGCCIKCGKPRTRNATYCDHHATIVRERRKPADSFPRLLWSRALNAFLTPQ